MTLQTIEHGAMVTFAYTNYRDVKENRIVRFSALQYGANEYHPEPTWLLHGYCFQRKGYRSFDLARIDGATVETH